MKSPNLSKKILYGNKYRLSFTLIEALVSMALMAFLVTTTSFILIDSKKANEVVWSRNLQNKRCQSVLEYLKNDIKRIYTPLDDTQVLLANHIEHGESSKDSVAFLMEISLSHECQLAEVEYLSSPSTPQQLLAEDYEAKTINEHQDQLFAIYRRYSKNTDQDLQSGGQYELLIDRVSHFSIRYLEQEGWTDMPTTLPKMLHLKIVHQMDRQEQDFEAYISLASI
jgi:type II secretory pathway component PulJ